MGSQRVLISSTSNAVGREREQFALRMSHMQCKLSHTHILGSMQGVRARQSVTPGELGPFLLSFFFFWSPKLRGQKGKENKKRRQTAQDSPGQSSISYSNQNNQANSSAHPPRHISPICDSPMLFFCGARTGGLSRINHQHAGQAGARMFLSHYPIGA